MYSLCENRFPLVGSPSTCTLDTALIPLPSFLLLAFCAIINIRIVRKKFPILSLHSSNALDASNANSTYPNLSPSMTQTNPPTPTPPLPKWVFFPYAFLIFCAIGMRILEITRLVLAKQGIGLLAVDVLGMVQVLGIYLQEGRGKGPIMSFAFVVHWFLLVVFQAVKLVRLNQLNFVDPAKGTKYPTSDWLLDNAVLFGLFILFLVPETVHLGICAQSAKTGKVKRETTEVE